MFILSKFFLTRKILIYYKCEILFTIKPGDNYPIDEFIVRLRRPEMIIRENQPLELPPDVVRGTLSLSVSINEFSSRCSLTTDLLALFWKHHRPFVSKQTPEIRHQWICSVYVLCSLFYNSSQSLTQ